MSDLVPPFDPSVIDNDGLAWPVDYSAGYGAGKQRALVLGGGGVFFVAWQVAYLHGLETRGVHLERADIYVGTSAGSIVASLLAHKGLSRFMKEVNFLSHHPKLVGALAPAGDLEASQVRALTLFQSAPSPEPALVKEIGHAALAARTPADSEMRRNVGLMLAKRNWPNPGLHISATDTYSGERLIITESTGVSNPRAAAASSAVPGLFPPQPILNRRAMDGGVSGSGTHCDVVSGAGRALVISLELGLPEPMSGMTIPAGAVDREIEELERHGTRVVARGPSSVDVERLMDPLATESAIELGVAQAEQDAAAIATFWNEG